MKTRTEIMGRFHRMKMENGAERFEGSIDSTLFKRVKQSEINVMLIPTDSIPDLKHFMSKEENETIDLVMFGVFKEEEKKSRGR